MAEKLNEKEINKKISELKIELLKQAQKSKNIRKEIAKLITQKTKLLEGKPSEGGRS